jgi:hypothetical protein
LYAYMNNKTIKIIFKKWLVEKINWWADKNKQINNSVWIITKNKVLAHTPVWIDLKNMLNERS